ncbi:hypothetical protein Q9189_007524 [Teloschistes chrysophthalmus]
MVASRLCHLLLASLGLFVINIAAFPSPPRSDYVPNIVPKHENKGTTERPQIYPRMDGPTDGTQDQEMYSSAGTNGTEPGFIPHLSITREEVNCSDLSTGRDNKCWDELQLTTWVENWIVGHTCYQDEGFSSCFLRQVGYPELDCTGIKLATCTPPPTKGDGDTRIFYVAYNIYAINQYFGSWYTAVGNAANTAGLNVDAIVQLIDPPSDTHLILDDILIALTGIFAVLPGLGFNIGSMLDHAVEDATEVAQSLRLGLQFVENAIIGFPQIGRYLYPIDTPASALLQIADLKNQLGDLIAQVQSNLNKTVSSVMADPAEYLAFASQGNFTTNAPSLPDQSEYLLYAFNTYVISAGLRGNNIYGTIAKDTNVQALATNGSQNNLAIDLSACIGYNSENVCDTWWYSANYDSTFGLDHFSHRERGFGDVMTQLFQKYTTGQLLFDNAYACNLNGNFGKPVSVTVNEQGINTQCLSQLRILTWDMSCTDVRNRQCEFLEKEQEPQGMWLGNCGSHSYFSVMDDPVYCVPNSYLGPLVLQRDYKLDRN